MKIETIITAAIGGVAGILGGILAYIQYFAERKEKKEATILEAALAKSLEPMQADLQETRKELHKAMKKIEALTQENHEIRLDTTRTQFLMLIQHQPKNHDTILKVAERYFCQLRGDWYMSVEFQAWADKEKINIPKSVSIAMEENDKK